MSEFNNNDHFFNLEEDLKTDIALSKDELFSIIDQSENKDLINRGKNNDIDLNNIVQENISMNRDNFGDIIAVFSVTELEEEYKKKSKLKYYIDEKSDKIDTFNYNTERNALLDKFSEAKTTNILSKDENILLDEDLQIIENDKDEKLPEQINEENKTFQKESELDESLSIKEIKSVINYLDELLDALPEDKIEEFVKSDYYKLYKKVLDELKTENNYK
ncbi:MAG: hypothetical protein NUV32_06810 [Exilispira sp.]|jgi:hypothetical protein|nr:hypothetical protein [Exilispira sp.]